MLNDPWGGVKVACYLAAAYFSWVFAIDAVNCLYSLYKCGAIQCTASVVVV